MGVSFVFDGAEVPSHRKLLEEMGVTRFGVNYWRLYKRGLPKTKPWRVSERFQDGASVYLHPGRPDEDAISEVFEAYRGAISENGQDLAGVVDFDPDTDLAESLHRDWDDDLMWAVWHEKAPLSLESMASQFLHLALPYGAIEAVPGLSTRCYALTSQYGTVWHGLGCAKPDNLRQIPFQTASTQAWLAPMLRGETLVWDGTRLARYPSSMKEQARRRYRHIYEKAGLSVDKIMADDHKETTRLAIWSLLQQESRWKGSPVSEVSDNTDPLDDPGSVERGVSEPDNNSPRGGTPITIRNPSETMPMPVMGFREEVDTEVIDGSAVQVPRTHVTSQSQSMRQCNTCFVAANCPAFTPSSTCAFNLPIEVKTKEQLTSLMHTMVEMQAQRVAFARYAEETTGGGYPDPNVGKEFDRFMEMVKNLKEIESNATVERITVERKGNSGWMSRLFGADPEQAQALPNPVSPDLVLKRQIED